MPADPLLPLHPGPPTKRTLRILYADDVAELRELARLSFSRDGHVIECVPDGEEAYHRVAVDSAFDLVLTDHHMPRMNGLDLVTHLREMHYPGRIVVLTSDLNPKSETEYRRLHVDGILHKPVFPPALRKLVADLFPELRAPEPATVSVGSAAPFSARR